MARKHTKKTIERPANSLPPKELQREWNKYLDAHLGHPKHRPNFEILVTPQQLEYLAENVPEDWMKLKPSPKMRAYLEALRRSLPKLTLIQRLVVKKYFGIERESKNQTEIAKELGLPSQVVAFRYLEKAKARLNVLIRRELRKIVRKQLSSPTIVDEELG